MAASRKIKTEGGKHKIKVSDLIEKLQKFDGELQVKIGETKFSEPDQDIKDATIASDDFGTTVHVSLWKE